MKSFTEIAPIDRKKKRPAIKKVEVKKLKLLKRQKAKVTPITKKNLK